MSIQSQFQSAPLLGIYTNYRPYNQQKNQNENESASRELHHLPMTLFTRVTDVYSSMQNLRIIQKHLVYLIGLSHELASKNNCLSNYEYLGQYGKIVKLVVNKNKTYNTNGPNGPSYSCHVSFSSINESSMAILTLDNAVVDNHVFKASYGTTKYCTNFLRNSVCLNRECLYLHAIADDRDIISRDRMNDKNLFADQHVMAIEYSGIFNKKTREEIEKCKDKATVFPNVSTVYMKDIVIEYQKKNLMMSNEEQAEEKAASVGNDNQEQALMKNTKKKQYVSIMNLDKLYQRQNQSRFDFAREVTTLPPIENTIDVPEPISNFINVNFKRSILFKKEQDDLSQYYFSRPKPKAHEAEDSWSSLLTTLDLFTSFEDGNQSTKKINENESVILVEKFHT